MDRKVILNPHNSEHITHIHKHDDYFDIRYRCGHVDNTFVGWCTGESRVQRVERLATLLCEDCEAEQLKVIADSFIDYSEPVTAETLINVEEDE